MRDDVRPHSPRGGRNLDEFYKEWADDGTEYLNDAEQNEWDASDFAWDYAGEDNDANGMRASEEGLGAFAPGQYSGSRMARNNMSEDGKSGNRAGKRRKKKTSKAGSIILSLLILLCVAGFAFYYFLGNSFLIKGNWTGSIDYSESVSESIKNYLRDVDGSENINVDDAVGNINITTSFRIESSDKFEKTIDEESYKAALGSAENSLKAVMQELLTSKLQAMEVQTDATIDELIQEMLGMSLEEYLNQYGPQLLPSFKDIAAEENRSGTYEYSRNSLKLSCLDGTIYDVRYLVSDEMLVLSIDGKEYIYKKEK